MRTCPIITVQGYHPDKSSLWNTEDVISYLQQNKETLFKAASNSRLLTSSCFYEAGYKTDEETEFTKATFTMKDEDYITYDGKYLFSFKKLFLFFSDPTGYSFAKNCLYSYNHYKSLFKDKRVRALLEECQEELEIKLLSESIGAMRATATTEGSKGTAAAKWLASKGWGDKQLSKQSLSDEKAEAIDMSANVYLTSFLENRVQ